LQSVYVAAEHRQGGVFRALFQHLAAAAEADPEVVALRLYCETHNAAALATYRRLGMQDAGYLVLERRLRATY
jgi:ribosomal protein S18 acetylase RimI-like enzyme